MILYSTDWCGCSLPEAVGLANVNRGEESLASTAHMGYELQLIMDARTLSERPCYILPMFFYIFYGRLSWPNG